MEQATRQTLASSQQRRTCSKQRKTLPLTCTGPRKYDTRSGRHVDGERTSTHSR